MRDEAPQSLIEKIYGIRTVKLRILTLTLEVIEWDVVEKGLFAHAL